MVAEHIAMPTVFVANDGSDALFKADNVLPHVAIIDVQLPKIDGFDVTTKILSKKGDHNPSVILLSEIPDQEHFIDQVVTGQVQFLVPGEMAQKFPAAIAKALNRVSKESDSAYSLKFLSPEEILFREGDEAKSVFLLKSGELLAIKSIHGKDVAIGKIIAGEFVGEMAHINDDVRSATIRATNDCELIEIPRNALDTLLFSKPAWAKALLVTLSRRLKTTNSNFVKKMG